MLILIFLLFLQVPKDSHRDSLEIKLKLTNGKITQLLREREALLDSLKMEKDTLLYGRKK